MLPFRNIMNIMMLQSGGGRQLQEATSYRILYALRFPIVGASIVLLAVFSVVISLTGPSGQTSLEKALSQIEPTTDYLESQLPEPTISPDLKQALPSATEDSTNSLSAQEEQERYNQNLRLENVTQEPYIPNFVPKGNTVANISSFTPVVPTSNLEPQPPVQPPPAQNPQPYPEVIYADSVEQWRNSVETAINAYGGPNSDTNRFLRIMQCESMGRPDATNSSSGAAGLMQHLPQYWDARAVSAGYSGYSPYDPVANINVSAWLIYQAPGGGWQHWVCQ